MPETRRLSQRDLLISLYEAQAASKERDAKTQYLLVAILAAVGGSKLVGTPPLTVVSFLVLLSSTVFSLLVLARAWKNQGPIKYVISVLLVTATTALATNLGVDGTLADFLSVLRLALAGSIAYWAATLRVFKKEQVIMEE